MLVLVSRQYRHYNHLLTFLSIDSSFLSLLYFTRNGLAFVEAVKDIDTSGVDPMLSPIGTPYHST